MKKTILILTLVLAAFTSALAQKTKKQTSADPYTYLLTDFRKIKWGTHVDSIYVDGAKVDLTKAPEMAEKNAYVIKNDNLTLGTVSLQNLYYVFNQRGRFIGVMMIGRREFEGRKQLGEMKYILTYKFGNSELREIPGAIQYYWMVDDVRITLNDEESVGLFTVEFYSDFERSESKKINMSVDDF